MPDDDEWRAVLDLAFECDILTKEDVAYLLRPDILRRMKAGYRVMQPSKMLTTP